MLRDATRLYYCSKVCTNYVSGSGSTLNFRLINAAHKRHGMLEITVGLARTNGIYESHATKGNTHAQRRPPHTRW